MLPLSRRSNDAREQIDHRNRRANENFSEDAEF